MPTRPIKHLLGIALLAALVALAAVALTSGSETDREAAKQDVAKPETIRSDFADLARDKSCGEFRRRGPGGYPMRVEVVEGSVPCRVVRRVLKNYYNGVSNAPWTCLGGGDRIVECEEKSGIAIRARFSRLGARLAFDAEGGVRFILEGGLLKVRLGGWAPRKTRERVLGERIRATCGDSFASSPGDPRRQARARVWPAGRVSVRYRFRRDMSRIARWCRLEHPADGHVAFVMFDDAETSAAGSPAEPTLSHEQKIRQTGERWARLFAAADPATCRQMTQPGCERIRCERGPNRANLKNCTRPSARYRRSFEGATITEIAIRGHRARARFTNGEGVELSWVNGYAVGGVWWIDSVGETDG